MRWTISEIHLFIPSMRVELTTLGLLDPRSNQLSYEGMPKKGARPKKGGMCPPHCSQMTQLTTQAAPTTDSFPAHRELAIEHTNVIIFSPCGWVSRSLPLQKPARKKDETDRTRTCAGYSGIPRSIPPGGYNFFG